jgi:hypothetical protein
MPPPSAAEEIQITPQCTLPVSKTNGHGTDVFDWDKDYDGWFEPAAPIWPQDKWDAWLEAPPPLADSPALCRTWRQCRRRRSRRRHNS